MEATENHFQLVADLGLGIPNNSLLVSVGQISNFRPIRANMSFHWNMLELKSMLAMGIMTIGAIFPMLDIRSRVISKRHTGS